MPKKSYHNSFNCILGKVGRTDSEHVTVELLKTKYLPFLLYGLDVCSFTKDQIRSLDDAFLPGKKFNVKSNKNIRFVYTVLVKMFHILDYKSRISRSIFIVFAPVKTGINTPQSSVIYLLNSMITS